MSTSQNLTVVVVFFVDYVLDLGTSHRRGAIREKYGNEFVRRAE